MESGVEVHTYYQIYNNKKSRYDIIADQSLTTDKTGYFQLKAKKDYKYFYMTLKKGNDFLEPIDDYYYGDVNRQMPLYQNPNYKESKYANITAKLFLDRAIYRPGQTIYFKGILVESNDKNRSIKPNTPVTVTFMNVNYQQVSQLNLTTNEFGTFSGSFTAPTNTLNGQMSLNTSYNGNVYFSVEDYKRPKFAVEFEKVKGTYRLGDQIKIKGFARAFSGANIDNADVKYRVVRNARYPYWWGQWNAYKHWRYLRARGHSDFRAYRRVGAGFVLRPIHCSEYRLEWPGWNRPGALYICSCGYKTNRNTPGQKKNLLLFCTSPGGGQNLRHAD